MNYLINTEFALLGLILERQPVSGYRLNRLIGERGFDQWAGLGSTSVYTGLKKLKNKGLIRLVTDESKQGKGPPPKKATLTRSGGQVLVREALAALALPRPSAGRFELALAVLDALDPAAAARALDERLAGLETDRERQAAMSRTGGGPGLAPGVLFEHSLSQIDGAHAFTRRLKARLKRLATSTQGGGDDQD